MNDVAAILDQLRQLAVQHAPAEALKGAIPVALICLVAGIGLSVLGAKFARLGLTAWFVVLGACSGGWFAREMAFQPLVCMLIGAVVIGIIGFQTFRLWVGLASAAVITAITLSFFGYQSVAPHAAEFERTSPWVIPDNSSTFAVPTPEQQAAYVQRTPEQWAQEFWSFLKEQDPRAARNGKAITITALVGGLCLGLIAVRLAVILATSVAGTMLVTTGVATLLTHSVPDSYQMFQRNPVLIGVGVGGFLVTSLILQTMLARKTPAATPQPVAKS